MKMQGIADKTNALLPRDKAWNHKEDCRLEDSPRQHAMLLAKSKARFHMLSSLALRNHALCSSSGTAVTSLGSLT